MEEQKKAFIASSELTKKIEKLQKELQLDSAGEVISLGLSMLEMSLGRNVDFQDKDKSYRVSKFAGANQTVILDVDSDE